MRSRASSRRFRAFRKKIDFDVIAFLAVVFASSAWSSAAFAAPGEGGGIDLNVGAYYSRQNYGENEGYAYNRRWSLSVQYRISDMSSIEAYYSQSYSASHLTGLRDTTIEDQVYSLNWVQSIVSSVNRFVPYFKAGIGNLERVATQSDQIFGTSATSFKSLSAVLGLGLMIRVVERLSVRGEATTYLPDARLSEWKNNYSLNFGVTIHL